jgi:hypothetical protein
MKALTLKRLFFKKKRVKWAFSGFWRKSKKINNKPGNVYRKNERSVHRSSSE